MPEELVAPKAPRKELGLDDSRSNTPQGFPAAGGKPQNAAASALLGESTIKLFKFIIYVCELSFITTNLHDIKQPSQPKKFEFK